MTSRVTASPPAAGRSFAHGNQRDFLRAAAAGGAAIAIPSVLASCKVGDTTVATSSGATGPALTLDFAKGDTAYIQFLSIYKQVQLDLYTRAVATASTSDMTAAEQALLAEIKNHETIQLGTINGVLGVSNKVTVTPTWGTFNFKRAVDVFQTATNFEDVSIGLYNGMLQHFISNSNIALGLEIQSVEGRHSAALRDDRTPKSGTPTGFSPGAADPAYPLSGVGTVLQPYIVETLQYTNAPAGL